ncbi:MAG: NAD(P)-dependent oxidoreductase [Bacteroidota bacterium]
MKFGIIKERKNPPDRRVALSPQACTEVLKQFPEATIKVEPSVIRVYKDEAYQEVGIEVSTAMADCDVLLGIKEVPVDTLIPDKTYFFFSHTIKKQPYNRALLQAVLEKNITLYDYELIARPNGERLVAFGRYAGIVGAYNGLRAYGLRFNGFELPKAETLPDQQALIAALRVIQLSDMKILLTGTGRVGNGAKEMLDAMDIKQVDVEAYLQQEFREPVYCQIDALDYNKRKDGKQYDIKDFYANAEAYVPDFFRFAKVSDLFIAGHFYGDGAPFLFTGEEAKDPEFNIKVVADISCDINGPVASTIRASTIEDPLYGYDPQTGTEVAFNAENAITVMAVDNLPCELPKDASDSFGAMFVQHIIPAFFNGDASGILERACMARDGKLTGRYSYLQDYVDGRE